MKKGNNFDSENENTKKWKIEQKQIFTAKGVLDVYNIEDNAVVQPTRLYEPTKDNRIKANLLGWGDRKAPLLIHCFMNSCDRSRDSYSSDKESSNR